MCYCLHTNSALSLLKSTTEYVALPPPQVRFARIVVLPTEINVLRRAFLLSLTYPQRRSTISMFSFFKRWRPNAVLDSTPQNGRGTSSGRRGNWKKKRKKRKKGEDNDAPHEG